MLLESHKGHERVKNEAEGGQKQYILNNDANNAIEVL